MSKIISKRSVFKSPQIVENIVVQALANEPIKMSAPTPMPARYGTKINTKRDLQVAGIGQGGAGNPDAIRMSSDYGTIP